MKPVKVGKKKIGGGKPCFIVAEMSANHMQDFKLAKEIIRQAQKSGVDAIKIQTVVPEKITLPSNRKYFRVKHARWGGQTLYELYKKAYTPFKWHKELKKLAEEKGLVFFSSPFDRSAVDFLEKLNVPLYKIASFELVDLPLVKHVAQTKKPIIMSTGMATIDEIHEAVDTARQNGAKDIILLKCVSTYPADPAEINLRTIPDMQKRFSAHIGLSDHSLGTAVSVAAVTVGATVIEKHMTLSRKNGSLDSFFSLEPREMKALVDDVRMVEKALGRVHYGMTKKEKQSRIFRRSIFVSRDISIGDIFTEENIAVVRPGNGLKPKYFEGILGKKASKKVQAGTPLNWSMVGKR